MTNSSSLNQKPKNIEVKLIPSDIKNEMFGINLAFFKKHRTDIFQSIESFQGTRYQMCLNPDESINIYDHHKKSTLYPLNNAECEQHFNLLTSSIKLTLRPFTLFLENTELAQTLNKNLPLTAQFHKDLLNAGQIMQRINLSTEPATINKKGINFLPLLRVYGLGLGYHVSKITEQYDIACLIINEPDFNLFYTSLFTTPWHSILMPFITDSNRHYLFNFNAIEDPIQDEVKLLNQLHPYQANAKAALFGMLDRSFQPLIESESSFDNSVCYHAAGGSYEDQVKGLENALQNMRLQKNIYNGQAIRINAAIFLIGSGPSLDASINYLKKHSKNAFIIACGSALSALVKVGIIPDIHILQERFVTKEFLLNYADESIYKQICCVKLNVVEANLDSLYKETFILQKATDPGSTLLPIKQYPHSYNVTPTVTNTGIALCRLLMPSAVYLFGLDYGSSENFSAKHSKYTTVLEEDKLDKERQVTTQGYNGKIVYSNDYFIASREVAEFEIAREAKIKWINIGEGAIIHGTKHKTTDQLPSSFKIQINKQHVHHQLATMFDKKYNFDDAFTKMDSTHIPESANYLTSLLECFDTIPNSRLAMMTTIALMTKAAQVGSDEQSYMPNSLFRLEFTSFFNNLYVQIASTHSDEEAVNLYIAAVALLKNHINFIFDHFLVIAGNAENTDKQ